MSKVLKALVCGWSLNCFVFIISSLLFSYYEQQGHWSVNSWQHISFVFGFTVIMLTIITGISFINEQSKETTK